MHEEEHAKEDRSAQLVYEGGVHHVVVRVPSVVDEESLALERALDLLAETAVAREDVGHPS